MFLRTTQTPWVLASQVVNTKSCDWVFDHVFNDQVLNSKSKTEQAGLFISALERLAESLVMMDIAQEGASAELFTMTKERVLERKDLATVLKSPLEEFDAYWKWLLASKQTLRSERTLEYEAYALLRVCQRFPDLDKAIYFHCINKARKNFSEVINSRPGKPNMISNWGAGFALYLHGCVIDLTTDIKTKTANTILLKAQEHMTFVVSRYKLTREAGMERYIKRPHYYLGCVNASMKMEDEALFWLTKAKVKGGLPHDVAQVFRDYYNIMQNGTNSELVSIINESLQFSKERLAFLQDRKKLLAKLLGTNIMEMSLTTSQLGVYGGDLTASVIMSDDILSNALSTSTLHFLTDGHFKIAVNLKQFLEPVKTTETVEAEKRLKDRLNQYGLEARRDIPGDGNCQMYSLSHQLTEDIQHAKFIRRTIVSWLRKNADLELPNGALLRHFVYDKDWDAYCNEMAKDGSWGDHLTLIAAAEVFNCRIVIVSSIPGDSFVVEINPIRSQEVLADGTIRVVPALHLLTLSHFAEFHYGSVHPIDPEFIPFQEQGVTGF